MALRVLNSSVLIIKVIMILYGANAEKDSLPGSDIIEIVAPVNDINSVQYHLYTPEQPREVCYFQPDESNKCKFNSTFDIKILVHGYIAKLLPGNYFEQLKDIMLEENKYNVFIVNWTKYDGEPYPKAVAYAYPVGICIGKMITFLVNKGINPLNIHLIGHSVGAHVAGVAGKQVPNLGRVTGLDPAGPLFNKLVKSNRLADDSAKLVDVIHTSNYVTGGEGLIDAIGTIDFYPNGGNKQPACKMGKQYRNADSEVKTITSKEIMILCYHSMVLPYFMNSIRLCNYTSLECDSYKMYSERKCNTELNHTNRMGFYCVQNQGLPAQSKFYLKTSADPPYCEK